MKRLFRGSVVLAAAVGFLSCSGDPTGDFRQPEGIVATPTTVFINVGETKPVIASLQDDQGNQIAATYEITDVGAGITVVQDTAFQHTTAPGVHIDNSVRFQVTASSIANSSFTINAGGKSLVVPVRVTPATVDIGISNPTPALGDTITLTMPAGALFTDTSEVTFAGGPPGDVVSISTDRTQMIVVPGPNVIGPVTISHTTVSFNTALDFTITSNGTVTTPPLIDLTGAVLSNLLPALGETVTLTLPPTIKVLPVAALPPTSIGAPDTIGVLADSGLIIEGATNPHNVAVSTDSSVITFLPAPNSDSIITVHGVVHQRLPQFPLILSTTIEVVTPVVDSLPASLSSTAPAVNVPVVLTSTNAQFTFVDPAVVAVGGDSSAFVLSQTASTITFLPAPASTGNVGVGAVDVVGFGLPLPSTAPTLTTSSTVPSLAGTGAPGTAPPLTVPAIDATTGLYDSGTFDYQAPIFGGAFGTFPSRLYRLVVPTGRDITVTLNWNTGEDLGVYWFATDGTTEPPELGPADAGGAGAHPESVTNTFAAGTYLLAVVNFGPATPPWIGIKLQSTTTPPPAP
jgi:hypothetical protein